MQFLLNRLLLICTAALIFTSCDKDEERAVLNGSATASNFKASSTAVVLDSTKKTDNAITFSWDAVDFGYKAIVSYTLQVDSMNGNFTTPAEYNVGAGLSKSFTVLDFNTLVQSLGLKPAVAGKVHARVKADVKQNTGSASSVPGVTSNVVDVTVTSYATKPQPMYPVPDNLFIVGDATEGGWDNPVPVPKQQFTKIDENTFGIILPLIGGKNYLLLPKNGDWSHKYAVAGTAAPEGGAFVPDASNNIPGPTASGMYKIIVDFVKGTYAVTPVPAGTIPDNLFIVGDATAGGWTNPVPVPSQQFTKASAYIFQIASIALTSGKEYLVLPVNGDWGHKYASPNKADPAIKLAGPFKLDASDNFPAPDVSGNYRMVFNFLTNTYTLTKL